MPRHIHHIIPCLAALLLVTPLACADDEDPGSVIMAAESSAFPSLADLHILAIPILTDASQLSLVIQTADHTRNIARLPIPRPASAGTPVAQFRITLTEQQLRRAGPLPDGDYLLACFLQTKQYSNVVPIHIGKPDAPQPTLELIPLSADMLALRASRPAASDPAPTNAQLAFPILNIDGVDHSRKSPLVWTGPVAPLPVAGHYVTMLNINDYAPAGPRLTDPHKIYAVVDGRKSNIIATPALLPSINAALPDPSAPALQLTGKITNVTNKPAAAFEITLTDSAGKHFTEFADAAGHYEFMNLPAGRYQLACNPPHRGQPMLSIPKISIDSAPAHPVEQNLSFAPLYILTGTVTKSDGSPAPDIAIDLTAIGSKTGLEYINTTTTDNAGRYSIATPFPYLSYLGVNGTRAREFPLVKQFGQTTFNYQLDK